MICFVVLHYKSISETIQCLKSLEETFDKNKYKIIVVDNNSLKKEDKSLIQKYTKDIVLLNENIGFAKANNMGAQYAIKKYHPEFLVIINNDVFITQKDFFDIIEKDYLRYHFDMLGPHIDSPTGESCNPFPLISAESVDKQINYTKKLIKIYSCPILTILLNWYIKIKHFIKKPNTICNGLKLEKNVGLHGCAIIFSKKYYEKYKDIFYDDTFLFYEEEFLYIRLKRDNLVSIYDPKLKVYHKEGSSIKTKGNIRKRKLFKEKEKLKSLELLKKY